MPNKYLIIETDESGSFDGSKAPEAYVMVGVWFFKGDGGPERLDEVWKSVGLGSFRDFHATESDRSPQQVKSARQELSSVFKDKRFPADIALVWFFDKDGTRLPVGGVYLDIVVHLVLKCFLQAFPSEGRHGDVNISLRLGQRGNINIDPMARAIKKNIHEMLLKRRRRSEFGNISLNISWIPVGISSASTISDLFSNGAYRAARSMHNQDKLHHLDSNFLGLGDRVQRIRREWLDTVEGKHRAAYQAQWKTFSGFQIEDDEEDEMIPPPLPFTSSQSNVAPRSPTSPYTSSPAALRLFPPPRSSSFQSEEEDQIPPPLPFASQPTRSPTSPPTNENKQSALLEDKTPWWMLAFGVSLVGGSVVVGCGLVVFIGITIPIVMGLFWG